MQELRMSYRRDCGTIIEYTLRTDPSEAMYWTTHRLKKSEIIILTSGLSRTEKSILRQELLDDIIASEKPDTNKRSLSNQVSKKN